MSYTQPHDSEDYIIYELLQDIVDPIGEVKKGELKTACQWLGRLSGLQRSELDTKEDWFKPRQEYPCHKCGRISGKLWYDQLANGYIILDVSSSSGQTLWGRNDFVKNINHPVLTVSDAQHIELKWGKGQQYRLCSNCHDTLIELIGNFFKPAP